MILEKRKFSLKVNESVNSQHVHLKLKEFLSKLDLCEMRRTQNPRKLCEASMTPGRVGVWPPQASCGPAAPSAPSMCPVPLLDS